MTVGGAGQRLAGGFDNGAVRVGDTVRRAAGVWTPAVHSLLRHLETAGFDRAPRALGLDDQGREVLSFLPGTVVGARRPWPGWVHSDDALRQVAGWLRDYHAAVATFVPPDGAVWRDGMAEGVRRAAAAGDATFVRMLAHGTDATLETAAAELAAF
ncbi:hypothetical protein [Dactylosporangium sp. NPDC000521]|uniref:hypothetical protein n=1 Tax=Dactylosporangium sp. NPDC000521 TaxID=3363975 RepID=UPI0036AB930E